jgi:hypothetical protein
MGLFDGLAWLIFLTALITELLNVIAKSLEARVTQAAVICSIKV